jgi:hypothetical protein
VDRPTTIHPRRVALALLLSLSAGGCALTFDARSLGVPAGMSAPAQQPVVGDTFNISTHAVFLLWGVLPSHRPSLERTLEGQLTGGRAIQDLHIRVWRRWSDALVTVLTAGLVNPISVRFQGVITGAASGGP